MKDAGIIKREDFNQVQISYSGPENGWTNLRGMDIHDCLLDTIIHMQLAAQGFVDYRFLIGYGRKKKKWKREIVLLFCAHS